MSNDEFIESVAEAFSRPSSGFTREPIYTFGHPRRRFTDPAVLWVRITLSIVVVALLLFAASSSPRPAPKPAPATPTAMSAPSPS